jgi:hypothetical protein
MKKLMILVLTVTILLSHVTVVSGSTINLKDIKGHWGEAIIQRLVDQGVVNGYTDGTFKPNNTISRIELLVLVINALNEPISTSEGIWYKEYLDKALELKLINQVDGTDAKLNATVTREETATIVYNALKHSEGLKYNPSNNSLFDRTVFDIEDVSAEHKESVYATLDAGMFIGSSNLFNPYGKLTRAETCVIIERIMDKTKRVDPTDWEIFYVPDAISGAVYRPTLATYSVKMKQDSNGRPIVDEEEVIKYLQAYRYNVGSTNSTDYKLYDEILNNPRLGQSYIDKNFNSAIGFINAYHNYSYLDLNSFETELKKYLVTNKSTREGIKNLINKISNDTMIMESFFVTDQSLYYLNNSSSDRTRGRLYFKYKSPTKNPLFRIHPNFSELTLELEVNQWYYVDIEEQTAYLTSQDLDNEWEHFERTHSKTYYLSPVFPIALE